MWTARVLNCEHGTEANKWEVSRLSRLPSHFLSGVSSCSAVITHMSSLKNTIISHSIYIHVRLLRLPPLRSYLRGPLRLCRPPLPSHCAPERRTPTPLHFLSTTISSSGLLRATRRLCEHLTVGRESPRFVRLKRDGWNGVKHFISLSADSLAPLLSSTRSPLRSRSGTTYALWANRRKMEESGGGHADGPGSDYLLLFGLSLRSPNGR